MISREFEIKITISEIADLFYQMNAHELHEFFSRIGERFDDSEHSQLANFQALKNAFGDISTNTYSYLNVLVTAFLEKYEQESLKFRQPQQAEHE